MTHKAIYPVIIFAIIFTLLFYQHDLGLNVLVMEILILAWLAVSGEINFSIRNHAIYFSGVVLSGAAVVFVYSPFAIIVNFLACFVFIGALIYPYAKSLTNIFALSFANFGLSQRNFAKSLQTGRFVKNPMKIRRLGVFVVPVLIIMFFISIYRGSSPFFDDLVSGTTDYFMPMFTGFFGRVDILLVLTFLIGLAICSFIFFRAARQSIVESDVNAADDLRRNRARKTAFKFHGLKSEYKAGVFMFIILNIVLLTVNALDIYWVWFNFEWNGQYLRQFVHEGTYLLLLSILCSIVLVLYFFRGNLNFYAKGKLLRSLSYAWIVQNAVLTISVAVRNFHYIDYFALAYKRIALILFLLLTLFGLYTVIIKVLRRKSTFYLFRTNAFALYVILVSSALVNWENLIVRYNFANADSSFLELRYVATFPDKALPHLDKPISEINAIKQIQQPKFPAEKEDITAENYVDIIGIRKRDFIEEYQTRDFLSWNWPEYDAYQKMK